MTTQKISTDEMCDFDFYNYPIKMSFPVIFLFVIRFFFFISIYLTFLSALIFYVDIHPSFVCRRLFFLKESQNSWSHTKALTLSPFRLQGVIELKILIFVTQDDRFKTFLSTFSWFLMALFMHLSIKSPATFFFLHLFFY